MATINTGDLLTSTTFSVRNGTTPNPLQVEAQLCTFLAQKLDSSSILVDISGVYRVRDLSGVKVNFGHDLMVNNLSIDTPNFIIEANFAQDGSNVQVIDYLIGENTFGGLPNTIEKQILIDPSSRALIAERLEFITTVNDGPFNNVLGPAGSRWTAEFTNDPDKVLSLAINTQHNNLTTGLSLLATQEDVSFNTTYASANYNPIFNKYFIKTADVYGNTKIDVLNIPSANDLATNNTTIAITDNDFSEDSNNFGIYSLSNAESNIDVVVVEGIDGNVATIPSSLLPFVDNSNVPLPSTLTQLQFEQLFSSDPSYVFPDGWNFRIQSSPADPSGGYYPQYPLSVSGGVLPFTINNAEIIDNYAYMTAQIQNVAGQKITITQSPLSIDPTNGSNANNSNSMLLTVSGETLDASGYLLDGNIRIEGLSNNTNGRVDYSTVVDPSNVYNNYKVYYQNETSPVGVGVLSNTQKTSLGVVYDISNTLIPTGNGQYAEDVITGISLNSNGSTLYVAGDPSGAMSFTSNIATILPDNYATYFTISESNNLTSDSDILYYDSLTYDPSSMFHPFDASFIVPDVTINVSITGIDISNLTYAYYREHYISKQITDLSLVQTNTNWTFLQGISGDAQWLTSQIKDITSIFPTQSDIKTIINSPTPLTTSVSILYSSETAPQDPVNGSIISSAYLYDQATITWTDLDNENVNTITIKEYDQFGNPNLTFTDIANISTSTESVFISGANTKGMPASVFGGIATKVTIVDNYRSRFQLPLSGFQNLYIETPLLTSTLIYYYVEDSNGRQYTSSPYLTGFLDPFGNPLNASEVIVLASNGDPVTDTITFGKSAVTCLLGNVQGIMELSGVWIDESPYINIDPYFSTESTNKLTSFPISQVMTDIEPDQYRSRMNLSAYSYQSLLNANAPSNYSVNGYGYDVTNVSSFAGLNPPFSPDFVDGTGIIPTAPGPSTTITPTLDIVSNFSLNGLPTLQLTLYENPSKITQYATIRTNRSSYISNMTIFHVPSPVFNIRSIFDNSLNNTITNVQGDDASFNSVGPVSSGNLIVDTGVALKYTNVLPGDATLFSLEPDLIAVRLVGDVSGVAATPIFFRTFQSVNGVTVTPSPHSSGPRASETLTIPYYRGYDYSGSVLLQQTYTIDRSTALARSAFVSGLTYIADMSNIYYNYNPEVFYNNGIGSIGRLPTFNWSRLPASYLDASGINTVPITVVGDTVVIINNSTSQFVTLLQSPLYTFETNEYLTSIVPNRVSLNDKLNLNRAEYAFWSATYNKSNYILSYSPEAFQDPATATYTPIATISDSTAISGQSFNYQGITTDVAGPFKLQTSVETPPLSRSYFVVAPPQIKFTQANINSVKNVPFDMTNPLQYDPSGLVTVELSVINEPAGTTYTPFSGIPNTNNVIFTQVNTKHFYDYFNITRPEKFTYDVSGSSLKVVEYPGGGSAHSNILYNDYIVKLPLFANFDVTLDVPTGVYRVKFAQDLTSVGVNNTDKNIIFTVGNQTLPEQDSSLNLNIQGTQVNLIGVKPYIVNDSNSIRDISHNNFGLQLYKYYCPIVDVIDISSIFTSVQFSPTELYYSNVTVPSPNFGTVPYFLPTQLKKITNSNIDRYTGGIGGIIDWVQDSSFNVDAAFNFDLVALDTSGQTNLIRILGVNDTTITKFTYITTPDLLNAISPDGAAVFRVDANGQISANAISSALVKLFQSTAFASNAPSSGTGCNNEFVAYNVDTFNV